MSKITTAAVAAELSKYPAYIACAGLGIEAETEHNSNQDEQRWLGADLDGKYIDRGVGKHARRVLSHAAELLRHGQRVRVYLISERTYPTTISSSWLVIDPSDFAK